MLSLWLLWTFGHRLVTHIIVLTCFYFVIRTRFHRSVGKLLLTSKLIAKVWDRHVLEVAPRQHIALHFLLLREAAKFTVGLRLIKPCRRPEHRVPSTGLDAAHWT